MRGLIVLAKLGSYVFITRIFCRQRLKHGMEHLEYLELLISQFLQFLFAIWQYQRGFTPFKLRGQLGGGGVVVS
jgi:hypothetical protein